MAKLALISDLHGVQSCLQGVEGIIKNHRPDGFVVSGDLTDRDQTDYLETLFEIFKSNELAAFVIWGNADFEKARELIRGSGYNINLVAKDFFSHKITGVGESDQPQIIAPELVYDSIFVTHRPPLKSVLNQPHRNAPKFHISGHLHSVESVRSYPSTTHIQVPTLQNSRFALFDPDSGKVEFLTA